MRLRLSCRVWLEVTVGLVTCLQAQNARAGFAATDVFLPAVARGAGAAGSQWYTTLWLHNPNTSSVNVQIHLLKRDQSNTSHLTYTEVIPPGDTKRYENAVETLFNFVGAGAFRVTSDQSILVNARVYSQPPGESVEDSVGMFFGGIPAEVALAIGQSTTILGLFQRDPMESSEFRYNFGLVETTGKEAVAKVTLLDETGAELRYVYYNLGGFDSRQYNARDAFPGVSETNARLEVRNDSGQGKIVAYGVGIANVSNDPAAFEMRFADGAMGGGSAITGITAGPGLTGGGTSGNVTLAVAVPLELTRTSSGGNPAIKGLNYGQGEGVAGLSTSGVGVFGVSASFSGVAGASTSGIGVSGITESSTLGAVFGSHSASSDYGILGMTDGGAYGDNYSSCGYGYLGVEDGGVYGGCDGTNNYAYLGTRFYAAQFNGNVNLAGWLYKSGGSFRIDHPLDPLGKYLSHSFVESPEMKNVYDGVLVLDEGGSGVVRLPEWFQALNHNFRYQLTPIGASAPDLHVAQEIADNKFTVAGGRAGMKVSWQVTGVRRDAYALAHPLDVEEEKPLGERGSLVNPEAFANASGVVSSAAGQGRLLPMKPRLRLESLTLRR